MASFFESVFDDDDYSLNEDAMEYMDNAFACLEAQQVIKINKNSAKQKMMTRATLAAAKSANDPLYAKYVKYSKLRKQYRQLIQQKYASKGKALAKSWMQR